MTLRRQPITTLLVLGLLIFAVSIVALYLREGSFEGAGERMDDAMASAGAEAVDAAGAALERTDEIIKDIADGPDGA
ncbi:MAG: hypothetical protein AAF583_00340 [Pseudomonadota bacterium]